MVTVDNSAVRDLTFFFFFFVIDFAIQTLHT